MQKIYVCFVEILANFKVPLWILLVCLLWWPSSLLFSVYASLAGGSSVNFQYQAISYNFAQLANNTKFKIRPRPRPRPRQRQRQRLWPDQDQNQDQDQDQDVAESLYKDHNQDRDQDQNEDQDQDQIKK